VLDTGDALVGGGWLGDLTNGEVVVAGMNSMGYDAMALGPKELSLGPDLLQQRLAEAAFPMLSANVVTSGTGEMVAAPYALVEVGDRELAIIGLTRMSEESPAAFQVLDPAAAATEYVQEVRNRVDTVILLTNLNYRAGLALAEGVPGIDLLVAALPGQLPQAAVRIPATGTLVVAAEQPSPRHTGRRVGRLSVTIDADGGLVHRAWESVWMDGTIPDDLGMTAFLDAARP
jgi:2',3'-cyclic-nucleotide 2'-phosphodiesterase (5'-nucleotidase family)